MSEGTPDDGSDQTPHLHEYTFIEVLLVEDNPGDALLVEERLREVRLARFRLTQAAQLSIATDKLRSADFDVILLDLGLPDSHGLDTLAAIREVAAETPIVVLTGYEDERTAVDAMRAGAQDYLVKGPIDAKLLSRSIIYAIERHRVAAQLEASEDRFRNLVEKMDDPVMILDDDGTVQFLNPAAQSMFGDKGGSLVGMHLQVPDLETGEDRVSILDEDGSRSVAEARVTDIRWNGKSSYLLTLVDRPKRVADEEAQMWTPEPIRRFR